MTQFEKAFNNISYGNLTLTNTQTNDGSSINQWFNNLTTFDLLI